MEEKKPFKIPLPPDADPQGLAAANELKNGLQSGYKFPLPATMPDAPPPPANAENPYLDVAKIAATRGPKSFLGAWIGPGGDFSSFTKNVVDPAMENLLMRSYSPTGERQTTPESNVGREVDIGRARQKQDFEKRLDYAREIAPPMPRLIDYMPSSESVSSFVNRVLPFMDYKGKTDIGKNLEHPIDVAASTAGPGGLVKNIGRMGIAGLSSYYGGEAGEYVGESESPFWKTVSPFVQPITEMIGMHYGPKIGGIVSPKTAATDEAVKALQADRARRGSVEPQPSIVSDQQDRVTPKQAMTNQEYLDSQGYTKDSKLNTPLTPLDVGGTSTQELLEGSLKYGNEAAREEAKTFNENVLPNRQTGSQARVVQLAGELTDYPNLSFGDVATANKEANRIEVERLYDTAMQHPNANDIRLSPKVSGDPILQKQINSVINDLENLKQKYGYEDFDVIPPKEAGQPYQIYDPSTGTFNFVQDPATNGNLAFYDIVKKELYRLETLAKQGKIRSDLTPDLESEFGNSRRALVKDLDTLVPDYKSARNEFKEGVEVANAHQFGLDLGKRTGKIPDEEIRAELNNINSYNDDQLSLLRHGYLNGVIDQLKQPNGLRTLSNQFLFGGNTNEIAKRILGESGYHELRGKIISESLANRQPSISIPSVNAPDLFSGALGAAKKGAIGTATAMAGAMYDTVFNALMSAQFSQTAQKMTPVILTGAAVGAGMKVMNEVKARRIAAEVAPLLLDPKNAARISKLADKDPMFDALIKTMVASQPIVQQFRESQQQPQAYGGRSGRATGGRTASRSAKSKAAQLMALVERTRKEQNDQAAPLLNLDDATVVKALAVANKNI